MEEEVLGSRKIDLFSGMYPSSCVSFILMARIYEVGLGERKAFIPGVYVCVCVGGGSSTRFFQVTI